MEVFKYLFSYFFFSAVSAAGEGGHTLQGEQGAANDENYVCKIEK